MSHGTALSAQRPALMTTAALMAMGTKFHAELADAMMPATRTPAATATTPAPTL
ncbi:hypothetical protein [Actinokineospora iranica]|uniref:hypothetical protein n=1 Tax=Actinokineospora iranica TaxID=1271860 RepID=UPI001E40CD96|nr:hypothetical protein [Actinokineospora iranica]